MSNLKEFDSWLKKINKSVEDEAKKIVEEYTEKLCDEAKSRAPVDTGILQDSIDTMYSKDGLTGYVFTNVEYAPYQEFGTKYIPAVGYMQDSYDKYYDDIINEFKKLGFDVKKA